MTTPVKWGSELPVNTTALSAQDQPHIAALADGRFDAAHVNPLEHFLLFGVYEGRAAINGGWL